MKALVKYARGEGNMEVRDVAEPSPGAGQVKIAVKAAGICGSDIHIYHDHIAIPIRTPVVAGHEFCGVVAEVGSGVAGVEEGDRVTSETAFSVCETCVYCRTGHYNLCRERKGIGFWYDGAFAEYIIVPDKRVHRLPDNVDFRSGALCEPLAVAVHGIMELSRVRAGDTVLVSGVGPIGLLAAQVARAQGAKVILSGTSADALRFRVASSLGFHDHLVVEETNVVERIMKATGGMGVDVVLECSGAPAAARTGLEAVRKMGVYAQLGLFNRPFELNFEQIAYKELSVSGSFSQRWTAWETGLGLLGAGTVATGPVVTDVVPLEAWQGAYQKFESRQSGKIVFEMT
jgi:L-iditol 2-dehydrogenase